MDSCSYFFAQTVALPTPSSLVPSHTALPSVIGSTGFLVLFVVVSVIYFIPTIIAWLRQHPKKVKITMVNTFLGWTGIGYFIILGWSLKKIQPEAVPAPPLQAAVLAPPPQAGIIQEARQAPLPATILAAAPPPPSSLNEDDIENLAKLGALYEKGLLNADEFQKAKAKIIK